MIKYPWAVLIIAVILSPARVSFILDCLSLEYPSKVTISFNLLLTRLFSDKINSCCDPSISVKTIDWSAIFEEFFFLLSTFLLKFSTLSLKVVPGRWVARSSFVLEICALIKKEAQTERKVIFNFIVDGFF